MSVDRVARAMTAGAPSTAFTARVMAPIHGRPRPDFTARVMQRVAAAERSAPRHRLRRRTLVLVPGAFAVAAGVVALWAFDITTIATPAAPALAVGAPARMPAPPPSIHTASGSQTSRPARRRGPAMPHNGPAALPAIYTIAALETPEAIGVKPLDPSAPFVPALAGPAPLKVTDLPGAPGGSRDQQFKERP